MTAEISNAVFDAALNHIKDNGVEAEVHSASATVLVDNITLNAANYTGPSDNGGAGGGRLLLCLVEDDDDMTNIAATVAGDATHVAILNVGTDILLKADITGAPVTLGADDSVTLGTFNVILKDPS
jgi:hypothetical protein